MAYFMLYDLNLFAWSRRNLNIEIYIEIKVVGIIRISYIS